jgi:hypothetical protein
MERFVTIRAGKIENPQGVRKAIAELPDGRYLVTIEKKNKRTNSQNAYIHAVLFPELANAFKDAGYEGITPQIAKVIAKNRFLKAQIVNKETGEVEEYTKDTSDLTTVEMNEFIDTVIRFASENMNYQICYPNEQTQLNYD